MLYLAGADWSVSTRRIPEAMTAWLLPGGLLAMGVGLGAPSLYHWSHPAAVAEDLLLLHKAPFLNMTMFTALMGVSLGLWVVFAALLVGASRRQDREGGHGPTRACRTLSAIFLVVLAVTLSIVSFYLLLSLEAHWFSTMFAVLVFTDIIQTGTAFVAVVAGLLVAAGRLKGFLSGHHLHSLGKMVFASTGFWAYIYFCQFMLIWYANIPEETIYFLRRVDNGWLPYLLLLPALKFVVPFLILVPRNAKRNPKVLVPVSVLLLVAQFLELFVMVGPAVGHGEAAAHAHLPLVEFVATLGFMGLFDARVRLGACPARRGAAERSRADGVPRVSVVASMRRRSPPACAPLGCSSAGGPGPGPGGRGRGPGGRQARRRRGAGATPDVTQPTAWRRRRLRVRMSVAPTRPWPSVDPRRVQVDTRRTPCGGSPRRRQVSFEMAMPMGTTDTARGETAGRGERPADLWGRRPACRLAQASRRGPAFDIGRKARALAPARRLLPAFDLVGFLMLGLLGSVGHCVGMCSPFVLFVSRRYAGEAGGRAAYAAQAWYTTGRIATYAALGAAAGAFGGVVRAAGSLLGLQRAAMIVAGGGLVAWAIVALRDLVGAPASRLVAPASRPRPRPTLFTRFAGLMRGRAPGHPFLAGLFLGLLPCGLVYSALIAAVSRGGVFQGAVALALFGLGTAPALLGLSLADELLARNRAAVNRLSHVFILAMGAWFLWRGL